MDGKEENLRVTYAKAVHGEEEEKAVLEVLRNSKTILGEKTKEFESKIAEIFDKKHGIMVNSGSSANLLAIKILDLPEGSEIITPSLTFSTTIAPILQAGLKPVLADVEPGTYLIDLKELEKKITDKTKALMIPSLIGNVPDMKKIREICDKHGFFFIEDSCDTLGARFDGEFSGKYSDISTTSFYGSHIITALGGGGMICVNSPDFDKRCRILRGWGRFGELVEEQDMERRFGTKLSGMNYDSKFIFSEMAYNFLPLEASAAFGLEQLKKLPHFHEIRVKNFSELLEFFSKYEKYFILPKQLDSVETNWLAFPLTIKPDAPFSRREITKFLEENNIQTRPVFTGNILRQPAFKHLSEDQSPEDFPISDNIMKNSFLIGCHHGMEEKHIKHLESKVEEFLAKFA